MAKRGGRNIRRSRPPKVKSLTPPDSEAGDVLIKMDDAPRALDLDLGPMRLVARAPFNSIDDPADMITLYTKDNIEFTLSRSILSLASPHFKKLIMSPGDYAKKTNEKYRAPSRFDWEVAGIVVEVDVYCPVLDGLLRFVYPVPNPVFKEPATTPNELPYRLIGPIFEAAKQFQFTYVCQAILEIAHSLIYIKSFPEPGLAALRTYSVACCLKLDYDSKLKAARNALCVANTSSSPVAGLVGEGIKKADIEHFAEFHKQAVQACEDLFRLNEADKYPIGLSDVYASFIACSHCSGVPPSDSESPGNGFIRTGAAWWWQLYTIKALERLRRAPFDPSIFFENFLIPIFREAQSCPSCASIVHWKWCNVMPYIAQAIPAKIYEIPLDVDDNVDGNTKEGPVHTN